MELHVVFGLRHRIVRDRTELVGGAIGAGVDAEHAGHCLRRRRVDGEDAGVRVRRAHHHRIGLPRDLEVVGERPLPVMSRSSSLRGNGLPMKR